MGQRRALQGVRVLDFTWFGAGPIATKFLASNGAEVIRVESQRRVDGLRPQQPKLGDPDSPNTSLYFNNFNSDKLSILLDLNTDEGLDLAKRLARICDVVITNFSPRAIEKWGLDYGSMSKLRSDLIVIHMPAMGMSGPRRHYAGFGPGIKAIAGLNMLMGFEGTPPVGPQGSYPDYCLNPSHCLVALLAALRYRRRTGTGQFIDFSQYESVINGTGTSILEYTVNGRLPARPGNRHPSIAPHGVYRCRGEDRWVAIAAEDDAQWERLCRVMGKPEWIEDARFSTAPRRVLHADTLDCLISEWTRERTPEDLMFELQVAGVAAGVVQNAEDLFERDAHLRAREHYVWLDHPETGPAPVDASAFRYQGLPWQPARPAPCLGEHNDYVFLGLLGLPPKGVDELIVKGVLA